MIVSSLEFCASASVCRFLTKQDPKENDDEKSVVWRQIECEPKFHILLQGILIQLVESSADKVTDELLILLLSGSILLKRLVLEGCSNVSLGGFAVAVQHQPLIEFLDISRCDKLVSETLGDILSKELHNLHSLTFESCENLTDSVLKDVILKCPNLNVLNVSCNQMLTDELFNFSENVANKICSLSRIDLSGCQGISSTSVRHILSLFGSTLQSINISYTKIDCTALVYLSGYSLSSAVYLTSNSQQDMPFSVAELEASQEFEIQITKRHMHGAIQNGLDTSSIPESSINQSCQNNAIIAKDFVFTSGIQDKQLQSVNGSFSENELKIKKINDTYDGKHSKEQIEVYQPVLDKIGSFETQRKAADFTNKFKHWNDDDRKNLHCCLFRNDDKANVKHAHSYGCVAERSLASYQNAVESDVFDFSIVTLSQSFGSMYQFQLPQVTKTTENNFLRRKKCIAFEDSITASEQCSRFHGVNDLHVDSPLKRVNGIVQNGAHTKVELCVESNGVTEDQTIYSVDEHSNISNLFTTGEEEENDKDMRNPAESKIQRIEKAELLNSMNGVLLKDERHTSDIQIKDPGLVKSCKSSVEAETMIDASKCDTELLDCTESLTKICNGNNEIELELSDMKEISSMLSSSSAEFYRPRKMFLSQISELDISQIRFYDADIGMKCLKLFVTANHQLKSLNISWHGLTDSLLDIIAKNEPNLVKISLAECESLSNSGIISLGRYCKNLKDVDLQGVPFINDRGITEIISQGLLCELSLAECAVTDVTLQNIAEFCSTTISHLNLSWCENISDYGLTCLLKSCSVLESLNLRQCEVSTHSVEAMIEFDGNISYLGLCGIQDLTDTLAKPLVQKLKDLTYIDLSWNCLLTDQTLSALLVSCVMLSEAVLAGLKRITSKPFLSMISGISEWNITRESIRSHLRKKELNARDIGALEALDPSFYLPYRSLHYAPNLCKIDLSFSDKVNDTHLAELVSVCRGTLAIDDYYSMPIKPRWE